MKHATTGARVARHRPSHARSGGPSLARTGVCLAFFAVLAVAVGTAASGDPAGAAGHPVAPKAVAAPQAALRADADAQLKYGRLAAAVAQAEAASSRSSAGARAAGVADFSDYFPAAGLTSSGIPITALTAYEQAAARESHVTPGCGLSWPLLAGIGRVESDHGRFAGAVLHSDGLSTPPVVGIPLNGNGTALIGDTDGGALDGDTVYDRAVGPMQFIPSTWAGWGVDANGDGVGDPFNIFDAAAAAADYLCAGGRDLTTTHGQVQAILSYNWSWDYVSMVMGVERIYASAAVGLTVPVLPTSPDRHGRPAHDPHQPPVDPGTPRGAGSSGTTDSGSTSAAPGPGQTTSASGSNSSSTSAGSGSSGSSGGSSSASGSSSSSSSAANSGSGSSSDASSSSAATTSTSSDPCPTDSASGTSSDPSASTSCPTDSSSSSGDPTPLSAAATSVDTSSTAP